MIRTQSDKKDTRVKLFNRGTQFVGFVKKYCQSMPSKARCSNKEISRWEKTRCMLPRRFFR